MSSLQSVTAGNVSVTYVPAPCDPPAAQLADRVQLIVSDAPVPLVSIAPPRCAAPLLPAHQDRVVIALALELVGPESSQICVQVRCDPYLYSVAHSLRLRFRRGNLPPRDYVESLGRPLAEHLRKNYVERKRERQGLSPERLARVLALVEEKSNLNIPVAELAESVHLSPFHFTRMFRRSTGLAPHQYITMRRLERAKQLLGKTDQRMRDIARTVGYKNQAHFTRVFHAATGVTPRRLRAQLREIASEVGAEMGAARHDLVDLRDSRSVELWCAALRVGTRELVAAVDLIGTSGQDVADYLNALKASASSKPFL